MPFSGTELTRSQIDWMQEGARVTNANFLLFFQELDAVTPYLDATNDWTGNNAFAAPASGVAVTINGLASSYAATVTGASTSGDSLGLEILAGTTSADYALSVKNQAGSSTLLFVRGDGEVYVPGSLVAPVGGALTGNLPDPGLSSSAVLAAINPLTGDLAGSDLPATTIAAGAVTATKMASGAAATNVGTLGGVLSGNLPNPGMASGAAATNVGSLGGDLTGTLPNPTVNTGKITSAKMASGAAATNVGTLGGVLSGTLPDPGFALPLDVSANANQYGVQITGSSTSGQSFGLLVQAGTGSGDNAANFASHAGSALLTIRGDGLVTLTGSEIVDGLRDGPSTVRSTNQTLPASGQGLELIYETSDSKGVLTAFDRTGDAYLGLDLRAALIRLSIGSSGTAATPQVQIGNGTLGFYGTSPSAQQTLATGAGHTVDDVITALQTLGLVAN